MENENIGFFIIPIEEYEKMVGLLRVLKRLNLAQFKFFVDSNKILMLNLGQYVKPMSGSSRNNDLYQESRRLVEGDYNNYFEWTCEGGPKP